MIAQQVYGSDPGRHCIADPLQGFVTPETFTPSDDIAYGSLQGHQFMAAPCVK